MNSTKSFSDYRNQVAGAVINKINDNYDLEDKDFVSDVRDYISEAVGLFHDWQPPRAEPIKKAVMTKKITKLLAKKPTPPPAEPEAVEPEPLEKPSEPVIEESLAVEEHVVSTKGKAKAKKGKRPPSAYNIFLQEKMPEFQKAPDRMKKIGALWKSMSAADKTPYQTKAKKIATAAQ